MTARSPISSPISTVCRQSPSRVRGEPQFHRVRRTSRQCRLRSWDAASVTLLDELAGLINTGTQDSCTQARHCAQSVNNGGAILEVRRILLEHLDAVQ